METDDIHVMNHIEIDAMEVDDVKFSCEECPRSFKHLRSLKRHVASLHPNKLDEFSKVKTAEFSCSSCDMVFHKLYLLKNHKAKEHPTTSRVHKCGIYKKTATVSFTNGTWDLIARGRVTIPK
ncbi:hypothetical protein AVEN_125650-1 [Araneus ventricosus]|uniref:C2H2-type domain-containing protein n=1 Tax=Araneus ventricosus TaxID=182803 RepID=A0A4Y2UHN7_ARAVE|nr:hypothetical protein AVEN_125650-1 [Araneus ventricosus]